MLKGKKSEKYGNGKPSKNNFFPKVFENFPRTKIRTLDNLDTDNTYKFIYTFLRRLHIFYTYFKT